MNALGGLFDGSLIWIVVLLLFVCKCFGLRVL